MPSRLLATLSATLLILLGSVDAAAQSPPIVDADYDGVPDQLETQLALRYMPRMRPFDYGDYIELGIGFPMFIYRARYPTKDGIANPNYIVITFEALYHRDYGAMSPVGIVKDHDGDNEPFMVFLRYDYNRRDWVYDSISATGHWRATCFSKEGINVSTPPGAWEVHPNVYVGNRKHSNHVETTYGGCLDYHPEYDNDAIRINGGAHDEPWLHGSLRVHNVGEPHVPLIDDLNVVRQIWAGERVWGPGKFRGGAGIIKEPLESLSMGDWKIKTVPPGAPADYPWDNWNPGSRCEYLPSSTSIALGPEGGTGTLSLRTDEVINDAACGWRVESDAEWLTAVATSSVFPGPNPYGAVGAGNGTIEYSAAPNSDGVTRVGTIRIGHALVTVTQTATPCSFTASPSGFDFSPSSAAGAVYVTASRPDCAWTASTSASWIAISGASSRTGDSTVNFSVSENSSSLARSSTLSLAGLTIDVNQAGVGCSVSLNTSEAWVGREGGSGSVSFSVAPAGCSWTAASTVAWITITSPASGTGSGTVSYSVAANMTGAPRNGTLAIGGRTFTIHQAANSAPSVAIAAPANESVIARGASVEIFATATDSDGISRVEFYVDGGLLASDTSAPFSATWSNVPAGRHSLVAKAFDGLGMAGSSAPVMVNVPNLDAITFAPSNPKVGQAVDVTVHGANPCGAVGLNFGDGNELVYPITELPMTRQHIWATAGTFSVTATGHGNCVGSISGSLEITGNSAPTVTLTAPASGTRVVHPATVTLSASAADEDGIQFVEFYANGSLVGSATSAPYSVTWQAPAGSYTIVARAYDNLMVVAQSAPATLVVSHLDAVSATPAAPVEGQAATVTVSGSSACGAVTIDYGDGTAITYALSGLPTTQAHTWATAGTKTIVATGQGNCYGTAARSITVGGNPPPTISITAPAAGSAYTSGTAVTLSATAADSHGVAQVDFYAGATLIGSDSVAPYAIAWPIPSGNHSLTARAIDVYGAAATSAAVTVSARDVTSVSVSPAQITAGTGGTVTVYGSSTCGAVTIDYGDGTAITYAISGLPIAQTHTWATSGWKTVTATGQSSCIGQASTFIYINAPPSVALTSPVNGNTYDGPANITLAANASDADGSVSSVRFYANGALLATDTVAPYAYGWTNVPVGSYTVTAVATDNTGATASSTASITVRDPGPSRVTSIVVTPSPVGVGQTATVIVYGTNPCGAVQVNFGDGQAPVIPISQLPYTVTHVWYAAGTYTLTAIGHGNCSGQISTTLPVQ